MNRWWKNDPAEIYWLETTDRPYLGVDLHAPKFDDQGRPHPAYFLVPEVALGDIVFHYDTTAKVIASYSRVASAAESEPLVWVSHNSLDHRPGVEASRREAWRVLLEGPYEVSPTLTLADLRAAEPVLRDATAAVRAKHSGSLYGPLAFSDRRPLRPTQFYLTKVPLAVVRVLPALHSVAQEAGAVGKPRRTRRARGVRAVGPGQLGLAYRPADENPQTADRDPFSVDPSLVDRGLRGHAATQNALAAFVRSAGHNPLRATVSGPQFDLAWSTSDATYVAEVKSLTGVNEEKQLRLGLGQLLRYADILTRSGHRCRAVLAVERRPSDETWTMLCERLGVTVCWPPFAQLEQLDTTSGRAG